ncbi:M14 metallopeptidase family protein [Bowmanella pacifica]|uniref:Peptidase M14 n=1 Tax=Bowmanella pacifica TaxID=502051 RepID=A0A917Z385_9ALTE|nr:M14 metallopeptidase family protein [Bowmanella pacifica]GGO71769.1 peptidase M14 [Bowmanella pacifica]
MNVLKRISLWALWLLVSPVSMAQVASDLDYLPNDIQYDANVPTPESVLGYPVGTWHVRHDQIVHYLYQLAESSPRVSIEEIGRSHEQRPILLLAFSSAANQQDLSTLRKTHLASLGGDKNATSPLVLWMGYSVHGNEPSGANAGLLVAYYLAAAQGPKIEKLLNDTVILLEPALNPDGLSRFAQWANMHKGLNLVSDPNHREHKEGWPSGRTNHYWFDLNRDWLLLTHPESRARISQFHQWRPHVLTDFHEMGTNSTFFFQPGIPTRKNPWTPDENVELTHELGKFHASALDAAGQLYYTQEDFDDFYYGKGSTYPDSMGSVGILFEQASSRGHLQDSIHGPLSFPATIQNQVTTSISTFDGALANAQKLKDYQRGFAAQTARLASKDDVSGYLLSEAKDKSRFKALLSILSQHQIRMHGLSKDLELEGRNYASDNTVFVPLDQPQYRLIKSIFSTRTSFNDNTFYDVSNWNLPLAFDIDFVAVEKGRWRKLPLSDSLPTLTAQPSELDAGAYAYAFSWQDSNAPKLLQSLLAKGLKVKVAGGAFTANTNQGDIAFEAGSVIIPRALAQPDGWQRLIEQASHQAGVRVWSVTSGLTAQGSDLGSRQMAMLNPPKTLLVGGEGTSQYEVGEVWHYLDQHVGLPASIIELERLHRVELAAYSHIVMVEGNYGKLSEALTDKLEAWIRQGGVLIAQKSAAKLAAQQEWLQASFVSDKEIQDVFDTKTLSFSDQEALQGKQRIAGAVFAGQVDLSHPLAFGYSDANVAFLRNSNMVMQAADKPFITVSKYKAKALQAGYASEEMQRLLSGRTNLVANKLGKGIVIGTTDNLTFRGYWYGTSRFLSNAIYLSPLM